AILNAQAALTVSGSTFSGNLSSGFIAGESGAIESQFGQAAISDSSFVGNQAIGSGPGGTAVAGAVRNFRGPMTLTDCTFTANISTGGDGADGVHNFGQANGGALLNRVGNLTLTDCTLTNNVAHGGNSGNNNPDIAVGSAFGGGIFNFPFSTLTISHSTLRGNQAIAGDNAVGFGAQADGGGIDNDV